MCCCPDSEVDVRLRLPGPDSSFHDEFQVLLRIAPFFLISALILGWSQVGLRWDIKALGLITGACGLVIVLQLYVRQIVQQAVQQAVELIRGYRKVRAELRKPSGRKRRR